MKKNKLFRAIFGLILVSVPLFCATTVIKSARNVSKCDVDIK